MLKFKKKISKDDSSTWGVRMPPQSMAHYAMGTFPTATPVKTQVCSTMAVYSQSPQDNL